MILFEKTRYLRAVFILIPLGLMTIYFGLKAQLDLPKKNELIEIKGVVAGIQKKKEYSDNYKMFIDRKRLFLNGHSEGYIFNKKKDYEIFIETFSIGDSITIWLTLNTKPSVIAQFSSNENIILRYKRIDFSYIIMIFFGLFSLIISLFYIFKHPEDLFGNHIRSK